MVTENSWHDLDVSLLGDCKAKCAGIRKLILHPGRAHMDDLLTAALLAPLVDHFLVDRREPTPEEIDDPSVMVADIGGVYDPSRMCFDHHQDRELPASFVLFLQYLGIWEEFKDCYPWAEFMSHMDTQGPVKTYESTGIPVTALDMLQNPVVGFALTAFGDDCLSWLYLIRLGAYLYQEMIDWRTALHVAAKCLLLSAETLDGTDRAWFLFMKEPTTPTIDRALSKRGRTDGCAGIVSPATRNAGWRIYRLQDHPLLDLSRLEGDSRVAFAHKGGFIAETHERLTSPDLVKLIQRALVVGSVHD